MSENAPAAWDSCDAYERYVGRWSRVVAAEFLRWLAPSRGLAWADVGCGTGALTSGILTTCEPTSVSGIDSSEKFVAQTQQRIRDRRARFEVGDATHVPWDSNRFDAAVSGLVLNFVRDQEGMVREMARVTRPGGLVAVYAAVAVSPTDANIDEGERFPICQPGPLRALFESVGLGSVTVRAIDIPTVFATFDDYWQPFLGGTGAAPAYLASVRDETRERIRLYLASQLAAAQDKRIDLTARAWAVQGKAAGG